jgi:hypothetical protein
LNVRSCETFVCRLAPAARKPATTVRIGAGAVARAIGPTVVGVPATLNDSFAVKGTPANVSSGAPPRRRSSIAAASILADSNNGTTMAPRRAWIREMCASTTSRAESTPAATAEAISCALPRIA